MRVSTSFPVFDPGSFRDPDTKVFRQAGAIFRCLTARALEDWTQLTSTDFFARLSADGTLIPTEHVTDRSGLPDLEPKWAAVLRHQTVPFISYPYEWPFGMLRDAALLQLDLIRTALDEGMTLKDATPFNIQWIGSRPPSSIWVRSPHTSLGSRGPAIASSVSSFSIRSFSRRTRTSRSILGFGGDSMG